MTREWLALNIQFESLGLRDTRPFEIEHLTMVLLRARLTSSVSPLLPENNHAMFLDWIAGLQAR